MRALFTTFLIGVFLGGGSTVYCQENRQWRLDDIFGSRDLAEKTIAGVEWLNGSSRFSYLDTASAVRSIYIYSPENGTTELVVDGSTLRSDDSLKVLRIGSYAWSPDHAFILITESHPARRTKSGGNFGLFDVSTKTFRLLTNTEERQAIIQMSPDGKSVGFVRANNIFLMDVETGVETQLTFDGSESVLNGEMDWVYEEEFKIINGWEWSPDSKRIAFWRLDQSMVPTFPLVRYPRDDAHASLTLMRYPKPGDHASTVRIGVIELATKETYWVDPGSEDGYYVPRIQWTKDPEVLSIQRLNRGQDTLDLLLADLSDGITTHILRETSPAWIDVHNNLVFLEKSDQFLWTSNRDGFNHLYLYDLDGHLVKQLTKGEWEVTSVIGVNERRKLVYFIATRQSPLERHLYSVRLDGTRLTALTREPGTHTINMSPDQILFLDTYSSATRPSTISLHTNNGTRVSVLAQNTREAFMGLPVSEQEFFSFTTSNDVTLNGWMIKPHGFDPQKKYPVLFYVYGGPGSQTVRNVWGRSSFYWYQYLAQNGYMIVSVDSRGTGGRGRDFMQSTYRRLGLLETEDQIEAAKYIAALPYVDPSRIGIWGWSYGGYMTCMALTLGAEYFKTGIAGAPVTHWKFYDRIYTERYMRTPTENPDGYNLTSPLTHADSLRGNLLIIHGTLDDNVHWQNTIAFVDELIRRNKQVETMFYPGRAHTVRGLHLYMMMTKFLLDNL